MPTDPIELLMYLAPAFAVLASAVFISIVVWLSFRRRESFLPKEHYERERILSENRRKMLLILAIVWAVEITNAVLVTLAFNGQI